MKAAFTLQRHLNLEISSPMRAYAACGIHLDAFLWVGVDQMERPVIEVKGLLLY